MLKTYELIVNNKSIDFFETFSEARTRVNQIREVLNVKHWTSIGTVLIVDRQDNRIIYKES